jgi:L-alanine-DL-glutamate epimerase-like enolase superfamily enzyme
MIQQAKQKGLQIMMGCMSETSIGSAAIAHFLPQLHFVDMDGTMLLQQDTATGLQFENDAALCPQGFGLGVTVTVF